MHRIAIVPYLHIFMLHNDTTLWKAGTKKNVSPVILVLLLSILLLERCVIVKQAGAMIQTCLFEIGIFCILYQTVHL